MERVRDRVADGRVLGLIEGFLKQGVMEEGVEWRPGKGSPQGGVISPLLANIHFNELDWVMNRDGARLIRYADDMVLICRGRAEADEARRELEEWMEGARLTLSAEKIREADLSREGEWFDFLGYRFKRGRGGRLLRLVRPKSPAKLKDGVRRRTRRCNKHSLEAICRQLEPTLRRWSGYFRHAHDKVHADLDGWIRMRLRSILRKRRGLRGRGRGRDHQRWPDDHFRKAGLYSLTEARQEYRGLRNGVKC